MRPHPTHDILLVDPDLEMRACRAFYLQMRGFRVVGARAADDTLSRLRAGFRPCLVLVDPRTTGNAAWALVDYLRADSVLATVPLVLVTHDPLEAERHGVRECIARPATPESLVAAIERQCRRRSEAAAREWPAERRPPRPVAWPRSSQPPERDPTPRRESVPPLLRRLA